MDVNLVLLKKNGTRRAFSLPCSVTVIGRGPDCDLYIPLRSVSKKHCQLNRVQEVLKIRDLGSRNGTYLNGQRVQEAVAKPGDHMKVGPLTFVFQINGHPEKIDTPEQESPRKAAPTNRPSDSNFAQFSDLDDLGSPGGSGLPDGPDSLG